MNLILKKSLSERVVLAQCWELILQRDVQECSVPWKTVEGGLEILNNSQTSGRGHTLGTQRDQRLNGGETVL